MKDESPIINNQKLAAELKSELQSIRNLMIALIGLVTAIIALLLDNGTLQPQGPADRRDSTLFLQFRRNDAF